MKQHNLQEQLVSAQLEKTILEHQEEREKSAEEKQKLLEQLIERTVLYESKVKQEKELRAQVGAGSVYCFVAFMLTATLKDIAIGVGGLGSILSRSIGTVSLMTRYHCDVLRSCVTQALSRGRGSRQSLHAFTRIMNNEDLIITNLTVFCLG